MMWWLLACLAGAAITVSAIVGICAIYAIPEDEDAEWW